MASKRRLDKIARHGGYNILRKNAHLLRKRTKTKLKQMNIKEEGA